MTLVAGPWSSATSSEEEAVAALLARPDLVRSIHQPVIDLRDGRCAGYGAAVRVAEWVGRENGPWFRAAAAAGLSGHLAGLALHTCLRARATLPGERFIVAELSGRVLTSDPVVCVLNDEDDIADLILAITGPPGPGARPLMAQLRARGLRFATSAGSSGLDDLEGLAAWRPDVITLPQPLVRGIAGDPLRQTLVALVVDLADDISHNLYGGTTPSSAAGVVHGGDGPSGDLSGGPGAEPRVLSPEGSGVLAEGVETLDELAALRDLGVRWAQGWLIGRPRSGFPPPAIDVAAWISFRNPHRRVR